VALIRPRWAVLLIVGLAAVIIYAADQLSKAWVVSSLTEGLRTPAVGDLVVFQFVRNPGAAFSFASGATWVFSVLALGVVVAIVLNARKIRSVAWAVVFGLLLGGTLGNLTDRLVREPSFGQGHVIDFISTPWMMPAIYNVADCAIVVSMVLLVSLILFGVHMDGTRDKKESRDPSTKPGATVLMGPNGTTSPALGGGSTGPIGGSFGVGGQISGGSGGN
jgi:signal peptidase II